MWRRVVSALTFVCLAISTASSGVAQGLTGSLGLHDPSSVLQVDGTYYLFYTRTRVGMKSSTNRTHWVDDNSRVFPQGGLPEWHQQLVPANTGNLWAPDIAFFNNRYHLYYSVSDFGSQDSAIGLATSPTLDPENPNYAWTDRGPVIESNVGQPFNAIDPAIIQTTAGEIYMTFGSFWDGIYRIQIDPATGLPFPGRPGTPRHMAQRADGFGDAIEAPYVYERNGYFYLFVNWDSCCRGEDSTYNIRVGRSETITGPFLDRNGVSMLNGGGTLLLGTEGDFIGPGHASIFTEDGVDWLGYHYYDGNANGASRYNQRTIYWDSEEWPFVGGSAPIPGDYNNDGTVNAADYVVYRNLSGTEALLPNRNPALSGPVATGDYDFWLANFGSSVGGGAGFHHAANVPEPSSVGLLLCVFLGWSVRRGVGSRR